jgi:single-stranded-DNA-specific exonuclease
MVTPHLDTLWIERPRSEALQGVDLQRRLGVSHLAEEVLRRRDLSSLEEVREFLEARLSAMPDPFQMADMQRAVERLAQALRQGEGIAVHGDYDVDGVTGTALMVETLRAIGGRVSYHIPMRLKDGYGLCLEALESCAAAGARVAVSVDCGISAHRQAQRAAELGLDLIITDHHQPSEMLPQALAIVNPARRDCSFPYKHLAGVGVVFLLLVALRKHLRESGYWTKSAEPDLRYGLDLVALGSIADIVPLKGLNRALTKAGLELLSHSGRPGLQALKQVAAVDKVTCGTVGFRLAPRINAAGRLEDASVGVELLLKRSVEDAMPAAELLDQVNRQRQVLEQQTLEEADERWQRETSGATHSIVLADARWHPGVIGIVASRLVEKYHRPTVLIALNEGAGKGSARSIKGLHLYQALQDCHACLQGFGGHEFAAGLSIGAEKIPEFARRFEAVARQRLSPDDLLPRQFHDGEITLEEIDADDLLALERLAPYGPGNPQPLFLARGVHLQCIQVAGESHLRFLACQGGCGLSAIAFGMADRRHQLDGPQDILFIPSLNDWRGKVSIQLQVKHIRPALHE